MDGLSGIDCSLRSAAQPNPPNAEALIEIAPDFDGDIPGQKEFHPVDGVSVTHPIFNDVVDQRESKQD